VSVEIDASHAVVCCQPSLRPQSVNEVRDIVEYTEAFAVTRFSVVIPARQVDRDAHIQRLASGDE
jgi:hypothetical protein